VLTRVVTGGTNKEIAQELGVSEQAIKAHVSKLLRLFAVTTRAGLVSAAIGAGAVQLPKSSMKSKRLRSRSTERRERGSAT